MDGDPWSEADEYARYEARVLEKRLVFRVLLGVLITSLLGTLLIWGVSAPVWAWLAIGAQCITTTWGGYVPYIRAVNRT